MLQLFLGQIPEAIFFALFMIYAKGLKEKRIIFIIMMVLEYLLTKYSFQFSFLFHITYMITTFLTLKLLYKEKSQITDIFILLIAYLCLAISCIILSLPAMWGLWNQTICILINRIVIFTLTFVINNKLQNIQNLYKKLWNRNDKIKKKIKTTTFRAINIIVFNISFYLFNICMLYAIYYKNFKK